MASRFINLGWRLHNRAGIRAGIGVCAAYSLAQTQRRYILLDGPSRNAASNGAGSRRETPDFLVSGPARSDFITEFSRGSIAGFAAGFVVALFSRTLVLLVGLTAVMLQMLRRCGVQVPEVRPGRLIGMTGLDRHFDNVVFRLTSITTFILAAFVSF